ncbi:MAG: N-6 DNA methylase [Pseudomonadota bacterium]|nr:N-6 DNA methylase [Pseudomonadota bacterium]
MGPVARFFDDIRAVYKTGEASEHSYRPALQALFDALSPDDLAVINEPRRTHVGAPDFSFLRDGVPVGHCEAKDVGHDLTELKGYNVEQKARYTKAFPNLLYTNGLEFEFIFEGDRRALISIGDVLMGDLQPRPDVFDELEHWLRDFFVERPRTIHSSKKLAEMMAGKAALIKDVMRRALLADLKDKTATPLVDQYSAFKEHLIHDIQAADFADLYAETIAYGLFAARLHDETLETFSRTEALELLPKSNPFLRSLFSYIAGPDLDDRIAWIIDELAKIFLACDLKSIMADFGKLTGQNDPFLHFYETFLAAYNPAKRKARGVWYTPEPVVNFIVRAVDEVLKTEFGLADGLADTSKVKVKFDTGQHITNVDGTIKKRGGGRAYEEREVHRVQILDPATGTGTFLAEVIKQIAPRIKGVAPGMWSKYVEDELIPRLHGFELLMASYAMCHMKLDMILTELGYKPTGTPPRLSVYLTNSLEEGEPADQTLPFAQWLSKEAKGANTIKRDMPIMCVIGNPPYNIQSGNMESEQVSLIDSYRFVDGVKIKEKGMLQFEKI